MRVFNLLEPQDIEPGVHALPVFESVSGAVIFLKSLEPDRVKLKTMRDMQPVYSVAGSLGMQYLDVRMTGAVFVWVIVAGESAVPCAVMVVSP